MSTTTIQQWSLPNGVSLTDIEDANDEIRLHCKVNEVPKECIHCGSEHISGYDTLRSRKRHDLYRSKLVVLYLQQKRYRCRTCKKVFIFKVKGIERKQSTARFDTLITKHATSASLVSAGEALHVHPSTVSRAQWDIAVQRIQPLSGDDADIAILEVSPLSKKSVHAIAVIDVQKSTVLALRTVKNSQDIIDVVRKVVGASPSIRSVTINVSPLLLQLVPTLTGARILALEPIFLQQYIQDALAHATSKSSTKSSPVIPDDPRRHTPYVGQIPLATLEVVRKRLESIYASTTRDEAQYHLHQLQHLLNTNNDTAHRALQQMLQEWEEPLLNFLAIPRASKYIQSVHRKALQLQQQADVQKGIEG